MTCGRHRIVRSEGYPVSQGAFRWHRFGACSLVWNPGSHLGPEYERGGPDSRELARKQLKKGCSSPYTGNKQPHPDWWGCQLRSSSGNPKLPRPLP